MGIITSLNNPPPADDPEGVPLIGWHNVVTAGDITSTTETDGFPVTNLANNATHLTWVAEFQTGLVELIILTVGVGAGPIDYIAFAGHNFGSEGMQIYVTLYDDDPLDKVILNMDGSDASTTFTDEGNALHTWTAAGNAQVDTAQSQFGGASLLCDGTGDWITTPFHGDFNLVNFDFTIDCWFNCNSAAGTERGIAGQIDSTATATTGSFAIIRNGVGGGTIFAAVYIGGSIFSVTSTTLFTNVLNTGWHHLALVRDGGNLRLFIDGVQEGIISSLGVAAINNSANDLRVGAAGEINNSWLGWIDAFRLTVGTARWTANFTPPSLAPPAHNVIIAEVPDDDSPLIFRFEPTTVSQIIVTFVYLNGTPPQAAVMYVGDLLVLERSIKVEVDHVPITYGRVTSVVNGMSETGNFLGRIVVGEHRQSKAEFAWFTPDFYREEIDPFVDAARSHPFFWAWYPSEYPAETGYVWLTKDAQPEVDPVTQRIALTLEMRGIA